MRLRTTAWLVCLLGLLSAHRASADGPRLPPGFSPDFYLVFTQCKSMATPTYPFDEKQDGINAMKLKGDVTACERKPKRALSCVTIFTEQAAAPQRFDAAFTAETATHLTVQTASGSEYWEISLDKDVSVVAALSRVSMDKLLMAKLCHGFYLTRDEWNALERKRASPTKDD
jgi:hypothetical protein